MGLQEMPSKASGLFFSGILQVLDIMRKRKYIIDNIFSKYFINANTKNGWADINAIFGMHTHFGIVPVGKTPSKDYRQTDSQGTSFMMKLADWNIAKMYEDSIDANIIINEITKVNLRFEYDNTGREIVAMKNRNRWVALAGAYEVVFELEEKLKYLLTSIRVLHNTARFETKSPMQLSFYGDNSFHGSLVNKWFYRPYFPDLRSDPPVLNDHRVSCFKNDNRFDNYNLTDAGLEGGGLSGPFGPNSFCSIPWETINNAFEDILYQIQNDHTDIWYIDIPNYEITSHSVSVTVDDGVRRIPFNHGDTYGYEMIISHPAHPNTTIEENWTYIGSGTSYYTNNDYVFKTRDTLKWDLAPNRAYYVMGYTYSDLNDNNYIMLSEDPMFAKQGLTQPNEHTWNADGTLGKWNLPENGHPGPMFSATVVVNYKKIRKL